MRRIYPPPFNKLGVFVLYCLLSITVITLAQIPGGLNPSCKSSIMDPGSKQQVTVGYVHIFEKQPNKIDDFEKVQWDSYDFINVIGYPPDGDGDDQWNKVFLKNPKDPKLKTISELTAKKPSNAKVLLSIRDYNPRDWPDDNYEAIIEQTKSAIKTYQLDGVDIEYPGMRGALCHDFPDNAAPTLIWDKATKDGGFVKFMGDLRTGIGKEKTLMLTVGSELISVPDGLNDSIDYLNIEIYHYSLYENLRNPVQGNDVKTYPNAPNDRFEVARASWVNSGIGNEKIIMGVDFGNTFQFVDNAAIKTQQSVQSKSAKFFPLHLEPKEVNKDIKPINNICPDDADVYDKLQLFSWPWKSFSAAVIDKNNCGIKQDNGYTREFDQMSMTPWLYKLDFERDPGGKIYHFVSYEDTESLSNKLNFSIGKSIGGISVSDITYDDGSLISLVQAIRGPKSVSSPGSSKTGSGNIPASTSPTSPGSDNKSPIVTNEGGTSPGKIVGGIIGGLFGFAILGLFGFIGYRYHKERPKSFTAFLKSFPNRNAYSSSGNHGALRNTEIPPDTTNRGQVNTIIPIASGYVTAMFDFTGKEENDLSFKKGDKIEVLERGDGPNDWWVGRVNGAVGEFPGNYVKET